MDDFSPELIQAVRALTDAEHSAEHPEAEELLAYHEGRLNEDARTAVRAHLTRCPECSNLVLDLAGFASLEPPADAEPMTPQELQDLQSTLAERLSVEGAEDEDAMELAAVVPLAASASGPPGRAFIPPLYWAALAAAVLLAVGLGIRTPQPAMIAERPEVLHLLPTEASTRDTVTQQGVWVPEWADSYVLVFGSGAGIDDTVSAVRLKLVDGEGQTIVDIARLPRSASGTYKALLRRDDLPVGPYTARLWRVDTRPPEIMGTYAFEILAENAP